MKLFGNTRYASFWWDDAYMNPVRFNTTHQSSQYSIGKLFAVQKSISNFVRILTGKNIPVKFQINGSSHTDNKTITIGSDLTDIDKTVGLSLHEASHALLTDNTIQGNLLSIPEIDKYISKSIRTSNTATKINELRNWIEDRRVDRWVMTHAPGYQGYYEALYDAYFNSKSIDKALLSGKYAIDVTFESYWFHIVNFINKNRQLDALPDLRKIYDLIDLQHIDRLKSNTDSAILASKVWKIIMKNVRTHKQDKQDSSKSSETQSGTQGNEKSQSSSDSKGTSKSDNNAPSNKKSDNSSKGKPLSQSDIDDIEKAFGQQIKFLEGQLDRTKINSSDAKLLDILTKSNSEIKQTKEGNGVPKVDVIIINKITNELLSMNSLGTFNNQVDQNVLSKGLRLGTLLGNKIRIRNEESRIKFNRLDNGQLDRRRISDLGYQSEQVFYKENIDRYDPALIHISIDLSGSMNGEKIIKTQIVAIAFAKMALMIKNLDVVINYRLGKGNTAYVMVGFDSRTDNLHHIKHKLAKIKATGSTPEGLCFEAMQHKLMDNDKTIYFINFSDGEPSMGGYHGRVAVNHTKQEVNKMKAKGIKILSFFISEGGSMFSDFKTMYGKSATDVNVNDLNQLARSINKLFI